MKRQATDKKPPKANGAKTFLRILSYMWKSKLWLLIIILLVIVSVVTGLLSSYLIRPIINDYIIPGNIPGLIKATGVLVGVYLLGVISDFTQYRLLNKVGQRTAAEIRNDLFRKMEKLPIVFFDTNQHGDLMSSYTNDMDKVSEMLTDNLADFFTALLTLVGIISMMIIISPALTLVTFIIVPLMMFSARYIAMRSRKYFKEQQEEIGGINGYIEEMISGQKEIKVYAHEDTVIENFEKLNIQLKDKSKNAQIYSGMMMPVMQNFNTLNYVLLTVVGAILAIFRGFDVGGLAAFLQYSRQFGRPINELSMLYNSIQSAIAGAERIFKIMDTEEEPADAPGCISAKYIKGKIEFENVYFSYSSEKEVLNGISLHINEGEKVALIGTTGAGKTTIMNLIPRFFDISSGSIKIDGIEIDKYKKTELRSQLAIVLQDTHLFTGTIYENIRFGRLDATDKEVEYAVRLSSADLFIKKLPDGYNTVLENDGSNLSQGQRQLLNIARAAVSNPSILLLDEATSNIDSRSEMLIQKGLEQLMKGRTTFIIAHRFSTIRNVDTIYVIEKGQIVEKGNHRELMRLKGYYYRLYRNQTQL